MDELFAKIYVDESLSHLFSKILRKKGFDCISAHELKNKSLNDEQQLSVAIGMQRILITSDKCTFLKDSKALTINHFGIIIITKKYITIDSLNKLIEKIVSQYLNRYTCDEFMNCVFYI